MATIEKRTGTDGEINYRAKVRLKGQPSQSATFERLTDAKKWVQDTESAIRQGRYFKTNDAKKKTLENLIDHYIATHLADKHKGGADTKQRLEWWRGALGKLVLADVTPSLIAECRDKLSSEVVRGDKKRSNASVNRYLAALSHAFTIAVEELEWLEVSPLRKVRKLKEGNGRVRFLSEDERSRLLQACKSSGSKNLYLIVVLALSTGMRKSEIMNLRWEDVDVHQGRIVLHKTKNGERRRVALTGHALELLRSHAKVRNLQSSLLFTGSSQNEPLKFQGVWIRALEKAEITDFRFHDLRHCTASYLAMNGATTAEIAEVLGHKTLAMVKRYAHLSDSHVAGVVSKMNARIFG